MQKLLFLFICVIAFACNDDFSSHEIIDKTKVELSYYIPKDGKVYGNDTMTFFVDYQIKTTEPEIDGFKAFIMIGNDEEKFIFRKKDIDEMKGSFPFSQTMPDNPSSYFGDKAYFYVGIYRMSGESVNQLCISEPLEFTFD